MSSTISDQAKKYLDIKERFYQKNCEVQTKKEVFQKKKLLLLKNRRELIKNEVYDIRVIHENVSRYTKAIRKIREEISKRKLLLKDLRKILNKQDFANEHLIKLRGVTKHLQPIDDIINGCIELLPNDYFCGKAHSEKLVHRYEELYSSSEILSAVYRQNSYRLQNLMNTMMNLLTNREKALLFRQRDINYLYLNREEVENKHTRIDIKMFKEKMKLKEKVKLLGVMIRSFDNITGKCITRKDEVFHKSKTNESITHMTVFNKVAMIKNFISNAKQTLERLRLYRDSK